MSREFFPDPIVGWVYCTCIGLLTGVAAYIDTQTAKIPNRLNFLILGTGLIANIIRSGWMGSLDKPLWLFETGSIWWGMIDGLIFATLGFLVAFVGMFAFWLFGLCGGGDVKLLAAVGGWIGLSVHLLFVWLMSIVALFLWTLLRILTRGFSPKTLKKTVHSLSQQSGANANPRNPVRVTYSLPIAVATILVLLWVHRYELLLVAPPQ
ncbi:MAG: A24 family peptidase [Gemmataceae bacterium]|nr:A24 family peptidase [Gemmata sp.]MDW8199181.1 A24 family peptidase [Gemmataceae bacterium]